jgi:hypothetical protein
MTPHGILYTQASNKLQMRLSRYKTGAMLYKKITSGFDVDNGGGRTKQFHQNCVVLPHLRNCCEFRHGILLYCAAWLTTL